MRKWEARVHLMHFQEHCNCPHFLTRYAKASGGAQGPLNLMAARASGTYLEGDHLCWPSAVFSSQGAWRNKNPGITSVLLPSGNNSSWHAHYLSFAAQLFCSKWLNGCHSQGQEPNKLRFCICVYNFWKSHMWNVCENDVIWHDKCTFLEKKKREEKERKNSCCMLTSVGLCHSYQWH